MPRVSGGGSATTSRAPLGDATDRVNNTASRVPLRQKKHDSEPAISQKQPCHQNRPGSALGAAQQKENRPSMATHTQPALKSSSRARAAPQDRQDQGFKPNRQTTQAAQRTPPPLPNGYRSKEGYKRFVGPWQLGRSLGKGSNAQVRLCRHRATGVEAAVKIIRKSTASHFSRQTSLAVLDSLDQRMPDNYNGEKRVPMAVEREVAILKLIDHPNIMKLYDIWENRSDIYLVLEYVDGGDLFTYISMYSPLDEQHVVYFFRQIISAVSYCHEFNICHRDLKPENILVTTEGRIKIGDFGMAALHQTEDHKLDTFCGSMHYAAPELLDHKKYRGDLADVWSLGVILFVMMTASLPFDEADDAATVAKARSADYFIPSWVSREGKDLIRRLMVKEPSRRIRFPDMWKHPLVCKYGRWDTFGANDGYPPGLKRKSELHSTPVPADKIDPQLFRQLRSMFHKFDEGDLKQQLASSSVNDQKVFYWLLSSYRDQQLENFTPEVAHSMSDYHHLKPSAWRRCASTCSFVDSRGGQGRSISRFTVISNVAESEAETVQSYDPYKASKVPLQPQPSQVSHAKVIIHSKQEEAEYLARVSRRNTGSTMRRGGSWLSSHRTSTTGRLSRPASPKGGGGMRHGGHVSLNGSASSRRVAPMRRRGNVDFGHLRRRSAARQMHRSAHGSPSITAADGDVVPVKVNPSVSRPPQHQEKAEADSAPSLDVIEPKDPHHYIREEIRHFSSDIAKDLDKAFNSSLIIQDPLTLDASQYGSSQFSFSIADDLASPSPSPAPQSRPWDDRPLPPLPAGEPESPETAQHDDSAGSQDGLGIRFSLPLRRRGRRVVSAPPIGGSRQTKGAPALPSIKEYKGGSDQDPRHRITSAPPDYRPDHFNGRQDRDTIRIVDSPSRPKPLNIWKKGSSVVVESGATEGDGTVSPTEANETTDQDAHKGTGKKKVGFWFRRSSRTEPHEDDGGAAADTAKASTPGVHVRSESSSSAGSGKPKRKSYGLLFWKAKSDSPKMSISDAADDGVPAGPQHGNSSLTKARANGDGRISAAGWYDSSHSDASQESRNIEVKQNWLARLFRVKPEMGYMCFVVSRKRARQEVVLQLKSWRPHGVKDVQVDKERNIVFASVGSSNTLNIKEVSFAAEVMTVVEHGNRNPLSIIRFTQERGAASSLRKVIEVLDIVFAKRNLLISDKRKAKMMIKTLNS